MLDGGGAAVERVDRAGRVGAACGRAGRVRAKHGAAVRRWLSNGRIDALRLHVALDTTVLWGLFCVVQVSLVWRGRAVPLAPGVEGAAAQQCQRGVPELLWRAGLRSAAFEGARGGVAGRPGLHPCGTAALGRKGGLALPHPHTLRDYGLRFAIEEGFLDAKSGGFQRESSRLRDAEALQRLCLVMAAATLALVCQGAAVVAGGRSTRTGAGASATPASAGTGSAASPPAAGT